MVAAPPAGYNSGTVLAASPSISAQCVCVRPAVTMVTMWHPVTVRNSVRPLAGTRSEFATRDKFPQDRRFQLDKVVCRCRCRCGVTCRCPGRAQHHHHPRPLGPPPLPAPGGGRGGGPLLPLLPPHHAQLLRRAPAPAPSTASLHPHRPLPAAHHHQVLPRPGPSPRPSSRPRPAQRGPHLRPCGHGGAVAGVGRVLAALGAGLGGGAAAGRRLRGLAQSECAHPRGARAETRPRPRPRARSHTSNDDNGHLAGRHLTSCTVFVHMQLL